jgi:hypothetical protein
MRAKALFRATLLFCLGLTVAYMEASDSDPVDLGPPGDDCVANLISNVPVEDDFAYPAYLAGYNGGSKTDGAPELNLVLSDVAHHVIWVIMGLGKDVHILAGKMNERGWQDGQGEMARFDHPTGVAVDANGTVYVADTGNHTIRMILPDGTVTTIAGAPGQADYIDAPVGTKARFNHPRGLAVGRFLGGASFLIVADQDNDSVRVISLDDPNYPVFTLGSATKPTNVDWWAQSDEGFDETGRLIRRLRDRGFTFISSDEGIFRIAEQEDGSFTTDQIAPGTLAKSVFSDDDLHLWIVPRDRNTIEKIRYRGRDFGYAETPTLQTVCPGAIRTPQMAITFFGGVVATDTGQNSLQLFLGGRSGTAPNSIRSGPGGTATPSKR